MSNIDEEELPEKIYLAGALTSFGIANVILIITDFLINHFMVERVFILLFFEAFITFLISGSLAGYFVASKVTRRYERVGIKTGFVALLINIILMIFNRTMMGAFWAIIGYTLGGGLGGFIYRLRKEKSIKALILQIFLRKLSRLRGKEI